MKRDLLEKIVEVIEEYKKDKALPPFLDSEELGDKIAEVVDEYEEDCDDYKDEDLESYSRY